MRLKFFIIFLVLIAHLLSSKASGQSQTVPQSKSENAPEVNLSYGLLIDNSGSVRSQLNSVIKASRAIVNANRQGDETFIVRFVSQNNVSVSQAVTHDKDALISSLYNLYIEGGRTAIIDALYLSVEYLDKNVEEKNNSRQALILVTDGDEGHSYFKLDDLLKLLRERKLPVYIIGFTENVKKELGSKKYEAAVRLLNTLAKETGGKVFFPKSEVDWQSNIDEIFESLRKP